MTLSFNPDPIELAWSAGFFDGEGTTHCQVDSITRSLQTTVGQAERMTLDRFRSAVGVGAVNPNSDNSFFRFAAYSENAMSVLGLLWPYLSDPKKLQAIRAFLRYISTPVKRLPRTANAQYCMRGHRYAEVGVYVAPDGGRECALCRKARRSGNQRPIGQRIVIPPWMNFRVYDPAEPNGEFRPDFLRVPPNIQRAHQAVAWTFGQTERSYHPSIQT